MLWNGGRSAGKSEPGFLVGKGKNNGCWPEIVKGGSQAGPLEQPQQQGKKPNSRPKNSAIIVVFLCFDGRFPVFLAALKGYRLR